MALNLMGKKRGMIQLFDDNGRSVSCTVIEVEPNVICQVKTVDNDGYAAVQLGFDEIKGKDPRTPARRAGKPLAGHFKKNEIAPRRHLKETRVKSTEGYEVGQTVGVDQFAEVEYVDVSGTSKGKGFQGVMKRHNYSGGPASHGSGFHRLAGSRGQRSTPGRVLPMGKAAGHMGDENMTVQNLKVFMVDAEENIVVVAGAVPGPKGALVSLFPAVKKAVPVKK